MGSTVNVGTPSNNTVSSAILQNGSVIEAKLGSGAVTRTKLSLISTSSVAGLEVKGDGSSDGYLQLNCSQNSHGIKLKSPPHSAGASYTFTFPQNIQNGQFLTTDANGNTSWSAVVTDLVNDTSPQLGGDLYLQGNDILAMNNEKVKFGNSGNLQIYHNGSHAHLNNVTGNLLIGVEGEFQVLNRQENEFRIRAYNNGGVELYHDHSKKFNTLADGVHVHGQIQLNDNGKLNIGDSDDLQIYHDGSNSYLKDSGTGYLIIESNQLQIKNADADEKMIVADANGSVDLYFNGTKEFETDATGIRVDMQTWGSDPSSSNWGAALASPNSGGLVIAAPATSGSDCSLFINPNGIVGRIQTSGSSTSFNTSSDYRLKENQVAISDGLTRLKQLKPYRFNFKADASKTVDGFFAHEVTNVVPEAVTGEKDAVELEDNDKKGIKKGDIISQGIDHSKLVPLLTAALQEAIAKIETLETKVAALGG